MQTTLILASLFGAALAPALATAQTYSFMDDFHGHSYDDRTWVLATTQGTPSAEIGVLSNGVVELVPSDASGNNASLSWDGKGGITTVAAGWTRSFVARFAHALGEGFSSYYAQIGLGTGNSTNSLAQMTNTAASYSGGPLCGLFFHLTNGSVRITSCDASGICNQVLTSAAWPQTGVQYEFRIQSSNFNDFEFSIDGTVIGTMPRGAGCGRGSPFVAIQQSASSQDGFAIDYVSLSDEFDR